MCRLAAQWASQPRDEIERLAHCGEGGEDGYYRYSVLLCVGPRAQIIGWQFHINLTVLRSTVARFQFYSISEENQFYSHKNTL